MTSGLRVRAQQPAVRYVISQQMVATKIRTWSSAPSEGTERKYLYEPSVSFTFSSYWSSQSLSCELSARYETFLHRGPRFAYSPTLVPYTSIQQQCDADKSHLTCIFLRTFLSPVKAMLMTRDTRCDVWRCDMWHTSCIADVSSLRRRGLILRNIG